MNNGNGNLGAGMTAAPPPPPPPPAPYVRHNAAAEPGVSRKPQHYNNNGGGQGSTYEPPAAIQNAMMTKDKKPFTYTPGMGGKLDLSQIRSPRMARRVAKNANDEGIDGPPKYIGEQQPSNTAHLQPNVFAHPQVAVQVFPTSGGVAQNQNNLRNSVNPTNRPVPVIERQATTESRPKVQTKVVSPISVNVPNYSPEYSPTSPTSPTQVTLAKAPTPWMQNKAIRQPDDLPQWAKRTSLTDDESPVLPSSYIYQQQPYEPTSHQQNLQQPAPPPRHYVSVSPVLNQSRPVPRSEPERNVPIRIEERPSVFSVMNDQSGHHQFKESGPGHHMSRWNQPQQRPQQQPGGGYVIPIQIEGQQSPAASNYGNGRSVGNDYQTRNSRIPQTNQYPPESPPIQSNSFRVLQKITNTDSDDTNSEQLRKLQLTEDDRFLMNKFKEQVDGDNYLHKEEDPRYRGGAIPSRAFRCLQNMTDSGDVSNSMEPRTVNSAIKKQNRNSRSFDPDTPTHVINANLPASQQQVPEPRKYTGGAIPSKSFRLLQAMTNTPNSVGPDTTDY